MRLGLGAPPPPEVDHERLMQLFRNRAELKKAYSGVQDEVQRLKDRIKQQEGATARVQEMLQALEARLSQPDTAYPTLVFYQLRELWTLGRTLLTQFVAELAEQQEERERRAFLAEYNRRQFDRRQAIDANLRDAEGRAADARDAVGALEQRLAGIAALLALFQAPRAAAKAAGGQPALGHVRAGSGSRAQRTLAARRRIASGIRRTVHRGTPGDQSGCGRPTPRSCAIGWRRTRLLEPARVAAGRREPPREDYGDRARCEATMAEIQKARGLLEQRTNLPAEIKQCSDRLGQLAKYRNEADTVPVAESLAVSIEGGSRVLSDDIWEIYRVLLR